MAETHVISALRAKRAEISGYIHDLEKKIKRQRSNLAHVDAAIRIFAPNLNPDTIPPKRSYRRTRYFAKGEMSRSCLDTLRDAQGRALATIEIARTIVAAKGLPDDPALIQSLAERAQSLLRNFSKRGAIIKHGKGPSIRWSLAPIE